MKIIRGNKVYVQNIDIVNLMPALSELQIPFPGEVISKIFGNYFMCNSNNQYEFREYNGEEMVKFFNGLDYIINYDEFKDLSEEEIIIKGENICNERNNAARKYNNLTVEEAKNICDKIHADIVLADYKMASIRDYLWFKQGHIKMTLPDGIDYPEGYKIKKNGILSRIFKKK